MSDPSDLNVSAQVKTFFKNGGKTYPDLHDQPFSPKKHDQYTYTWQLAKAYTFSTGYQVVNC